MGLLLCNKLEMANKKKSEGEKKSIYVSIRVTKRERSKLDALKTAYGYSSISNYLRALIITQRPGLIKK